MTKLGGIPGSLPPETTQPKGAAQADVAKTASTEAVAKATVTGDAIDEAAPNPKAPGVDVSTLLPAPTPPGVKMTNELATGATAFAGSLSQLQAADFDNPDAMTARFLKLQMTDLNNDPRVMNKLYDAAIKCIESAQRAQKKKIAEAKKQMEEAKKHAKRGGLWGKLSLVIGIAASVAAIFTGGLSLLALGLSTAATATSLAGAAEGKQAADHNLDAQSAMLTSKRFGMIAEMQEETREDSAEILNVIMESKNAAVDAVMKMMNQHFGVVQKLMSAGTAR